MNARMTVSLLIVLTLLAGVCLPGGAVNAAPKAKDKKAQAPTLNGAKWLWTAGDEDKAYFRKQFDVPAGAAVKASIVGSCDNHLNVFINGKQVLASDAWEQPVSADVSKLVAGGTNVIAAVGRNDGGPAALIVKLDLDIAGKTTTIATDETWQASGQEAPGWMTASFDAKAWKAARIIATYGGGPWGALPKGGADGAGPAPGVISAPEGFKVEKIYDVPKNEQGSWVSLTTLPDGRLVASDQGDKGLYYISPPSLDAAEPEAKVTKVPANVSNAQGMVWAFGALYVNRNGGGLWRVTDSDNNGDLDKAEPVVPINGGGEHGPHAVIVTQDGKALYVVAGNHTPIPSDLTGTKQPPNWGEDLLLPRQWDARGHARGILAPGGWICRVSPDGKERVLYSNGYRNCYDIAINRDGEMFTFDSDMEWDFGTPWYRPTRVCHITSGSEFGWRSGTGKWPVWYPDSLPPVVDIGPASPVGVTFGTGANFPRKWQDALYVLDWTYGTIWAVHLTPEGSSYKGELVEFISGAPLPVTDATIGKDGAFYFAVGGRGAQSALYRVTYDGPKDTTPPPAVDPECAKLRDIRHKLEAFHGVKDDKAVAAAWPFLGHKDRHIRFAARVAIEAQPVEEWQSKALAETDPEASITAMVALARQGKPEVLSGVLGVLGKLDLTKLPESQLLEALRAYELAFIRLGKPDASQRKQSIAILDAIYPNASEDANRELVQLLVYLDAPTVVEKTMKMIANLPPTPKPNWATVLARNGGYGGTAQAMLDNIPPLQGIHYAFALRNVRYGWTIPQREQYFKFINEASKHPGGASYGGFLSNIRKEALDNCSPTERVALRHVTGENLTPPPPFAVKPIKGPGKMWTVQSALAAVGSGLKGRDFENGRNVFHAVGCVKCHRFDGAGGAVGPDLSSVGNKFGYPDLLEAIIEPSKVISDQYGSFVVETKDGDRYVGIVIEDTDKGTVEVYTQDFNSEPIRLKKADVASKQPSPLSQMPAGLANVLSEDELKDLLAYLMSRGNKEASVFK